MPAALIAALLSADAGVAAPPDAGVLETVVVAHRSGSPLPPGRATSAATRAELESRLPRSSPDALRFEPGVFVQQTAHSQGSAYLRGLTGQQTVLLYDGVRLNTSTWRQGPNQYAFTLDARALERLEVLRGGASTRFGSDALGGVIHAVPLSPSDRPGLRPSAQLRAGTADDEYGGRVQLEGAAGPVRALVGVGGRRVGRLRAGGPVLSPSTGQPAFVPRFAADGRTQLGTGFDEVTADLRAVAEVSQAHRATLAGTLYLQLDAPRTDACPPVGAPYDECLTYERQHRGLVYGAWDAKDAFGGALTEARAVTSWQRQHELRRLSRPASFVEERGADTVDTLGVTLTGRARRWGPLALSLGADGFVDLLQSATTLSFTDVGVSVPRSRGQYLAGSRSFTGGAFVDGALELGRTTLKAGTRLGLASVFAPGDALSGTRAVAQTWVAPVGFVGVDVELSERLHLKSTVDTSFRAPNLDDLTSRQQTGPGFQFENAALSPERATSAELGVTLRRPRLELEAWAFATVLTGSLLRRPMAIADCPPLTPQCNASASRFMLANAAGLSVLAGAELSARLRPLDTLTVQGTAAGAWGEGPHPSGDAAAPRVPLSRVPPVNGTVEAWWRHEVGLTVGAALRWALAQTRLAVSDLSDARIPPGGTPGSAVVDLRASFRLRKALLLAVVLENLLDTPWRAHGSSVNGPGRSVVGTLEWSGF